MDYTQLRTAIGDILASDAPQFQANLDTFIRVAEARLYGKFRTPDSRTSTTATITDASATFDTPDDFREPLNLISTASGAAATSLLLKEPSFIYEACPAAGAPRFYAILEGSTSQLGAKILVGPTQASGFAYQLFYVRKPPSIIDQSDTWLSQHGEASLLYEALIEGCTFQKGEPDLLKVYAERAQENEADLRRLCEGMLHMDAFRNPEMRSAA